MNKRILEIAERAGYHINGGKIFIRTTSEDITSCQQKFAELIVKECAKIADDGFASSNFGNGITGHQLLKHFGVEE